MNKQDLINALVAEDGEDETKVVIRFKDEVNNTLVERTIANVVFDTDEEVVVIELDE